MPEGIKGLISVAWPRGRAEEIAAEETRDGRAAKVARYDDETFCVHVTDPFGVQSGLAARYEGIVQ